MTSYFNTLSRLLREPGNFFSELSENMHIKTPLIFLAVSCIISTILVLIFQSPASPVLTGCIYFTNSLGMPFIAAFFTFMIMAIFFKNKVSFTRCFFIYAFSTGVTIIAAGIPFFVWLTEPWKWWLVGIGIVNTLKVKTMHAVLLVSATIIVILLFFWSVLPGITQLSNFL